MRPEVKRVLARLAEFKTCPRCKNKTWRHCEIPKTEMAGGIKFFEIIAVECCCCGYRVIKNVPVPITKT